MQQQKTGGKGGAVWQASGMGSAAATYNNMGLVETSGDGGKWYGGGVRWKVGSLVRFLLGGAAECIQ